jgi:hypothetical protein
MAIVKCRECGKDVSSQAETCPHCGIRAPAPHKTNAARDTLILFGIGALVIFVGARSLMGAFTPAKKDGDTKTSRGVPQRVQYESGGILSAGPPLS